MNNNEINVKNRELNIIDNDKLFQQAFTFSATGMALLSIDGRWISVNPVLCRILGYTEPELLNTSFQALTHPEDLTGNLELAQKLINDDIPFMQVEKRYQHKQGHYVWCRLTTSVSRMDDGFAEFYVSQIEDITEQKKAQELQVNQSRINERLKRINVVFENSTEGLFFTEVLDDGKFNIIEINRAFTAMSWVSEDLISLPFDEKQDNGCIRQIVKKFRQVIALKETVEFEIAYHNDIFLIKYVPIKDECNKVEYIIGISILVTKQRFLEQELFKSEQLFRSLVENSTDIITRYDRNFCRIYANPKYYELTGLNENDALNIDFEEMTPLPPKEVASLRELLKQTFETGKLAEKDIEWIDINNVSRCFNFRIIPEFDKDGNIQSVMTISNDISERKKMELTLRKREEQYRLIAENAADVITLYDLNFNPQYISPSVEKLLGFTVQEAMDLSIEQIFTPDSLYLVQKTLADQLNLESKEDVNPSRHVTLEVEEYRKDGSTVEVEITGTFLRDDNLMPTGIIGVTRDISEQKSLMRELKKREKEFRALAENAPDPIYRYDRNCRRVYVNPVVEQVGKIPITSLLGKTPADGGIVSPEESNKVLQSLQNVLKTGKQDVIEVLYNYPNGKELWTQNIHVPEFGVDGSVESVLSIGRDITQHKKLIKTLQERAVMEQRQTQFFNVVAGCFFTLGYKTDGKLYMSYASAGITDVIGISFEEVKNDINKIESLIHTEDLKVLKLKAKESSKNLTTLNIEFRISHSNKGERWIEINATPFSNKNNSMIWYGYMHDVTRRKQGEIAVIESEQQVRKKLDSVMSPDINFQELELSDILDLDIVQELVDKFCKISGIALGVIDTKGKVLAKGAWQEVCTKFHRAHPDSCKLCIESDTILSKNISEGRFKRYRCKNNMVDIATPIIIGGNHLGNLFLGQFFYDDEEFEEDVFVKQALRYGYNAVDYFTSLAKVPRVSHEEIESLMSLLSFFAGILGSLSYSNLKLANSLEVRKKMETELLKKQTILEEAQRIGKSGSWELDITTNTLEWSAEVFRIFEINPETMGVTYETFFDRVHPDDRELVDRAYRESVQNRNSYDVDHRLLLPDGRIKYVSEHGITYYDDKGIPLRSVGTVRDMTRRKKVEQELIKEKERAVESDRLKSAFLATMNHELRTPLNQIIGFSQLIKMNPVNAEEYIDNILRGSNHLLEMFEDILNLALAEQSMISIRNNKFVLKDLFEENSLELSEIVHKAGKNNNIKVLCNSNEQLLSQSITSDISKINQVLINLFKNAVKFTESGFVEFGILSDSEGWLTFYVKDSGIGIKKDKHDIIFDFFRQVDDSSTRKFGGIGIGLAISKKIVEVLKGSLNLISEPGVGSTFSFSIPVEFFNNCGNV